MPIFADESAVAGANFFPRATYLDEDDQPVTPSSAAWSLFNAAGAVVNSREDVVIAIPGTYNDINLIPADNALIDTDNDFETRFLVVTFVYTSSLGSGLIGRESLEFKLVNPVPLKL